MKINMNLPCFFVFCFFCHLTSSAKNHLHLVNPSRSPIRLFPAEKPPPQWTNQSHRLGILPHAWGGPGIRWPKNDSCGTKQAEQKSIQETNISISRIFESRMFLLGKEFGSSQPVKRHVFFWGGCSKRLPKNGNSFEGKPNWFLRCQNIPVPCGNANLDSTQDASSLG